jgi:uncharacterized membrane protein
MVNRARGVLLAAAGRLRTGPVDAVVLRERIRAALGRVCSHPSAIEVTCTAGIARLAGPILDRELSSVLRAVADVRGVQDVENHLEPRSEFERVPGLQGGSRQRPHSAEFVHARGSLAARLVAVSGGLALLEYARRQGRWASSVVYTALGLQLAIRGATNLELRRVLGAESGRRAIDLRKEIHIRAPVATVFAFRNTPENFPRFMRHLREVKPVGPARYRWRIAGPVGIPISWEAELSEYIPDERLAWHSVPGSLVTSSGVIRFESEGNNGARLQVRMHCNPPAGALGHGFARLSGSDPKRQMHEDLMRFKSLIEVGKASTRHFIGRRRRTVTREELERELRPHQRPRSG